MRSSSCSIQQDNGIPGSRDSVSVSFGCCGPGEILARVTHSTWYLRLKFELADLCDQSVDGQQVRVESIEGDRVNLDDGRVVPHEKGTSRNDKLYCSQTSKQLTDDEAVV